MSPQHLKKFFDSFTYSDQCWNWNKSKDKHGYGFICLNNKEYRAHRVGYELFKGKIPDGLVIDHLCRNTSCINPAHLEAVTNEENIMRGEGVGAKAARMTHCIKGHPLAGENIRLRVRPNGKVWRHCRACDLRRQHVYRARKKVGT